LDDAAAELEGGAPAASGVAMASGRPLSVHSGGMAKRPPMNSANPAAHKLWQAMSRRRSLMAAFRFGLGPGRRGLGYRPVCARSWRQRPATPTVGKTGDPIQNGSQLHLRAIAEADRNGRHTKFN
jgi:hypothetical protein